MSDPGERLPAYADLPIDPRRPPGSAWGVFGDDDELGTINLLTPERVRAALTLPTAGKVFSLNWNVELPDPPILGRKPLVHHIIDLHPGADDYYDRFYPQASSQWDALCHMPHPHHGYYNGRTQDDITGRPGSRNGIDHYARHGIVGRFVLADVARFREESGRPLRQDQPDGVTPDDLDATLDRQGVALRTGDILLVRMGWVGWYEGRDARTRHALARAGQDLRTPGLVGTEAMAAWLWDAHVAAVACDVPALEVLPSGPWNAPDPEASYDSYLHFRIIPLLGLAVGEMFVLDALAADCAADGIYHGLFTAAPIHKVGGAGSPANALALK
jgi:kynurenine formamidase